MFNVVATPQQKRILRESFYAKGHWGAATTFMTRHMAPIWFNKMQESKPKLSLGLSKPVQAKDWDIPNLLSNN